MLLLDQEQLVLDTLYNCVTLWFWHIFIICKIQSFAFYFFGHSEYAEFV